MRCFGYLLLVMLIASCAANKKIVYFEDAPIGVHKIVQNYELKISKDDLLSVSIASQSPELVTPFLQYALPSTSTAMVNSDGTTRTGQSDSGVATYLVNSDGEITFPILGTIKVEGMTHKQMAAYVETLIKDGGYILDPVVSVRLENFKVTMIGEVGVTVLDIETSRVSIFDALSMAGDMTIMGVRDSISIIRESDGMRTIGKVDINSKSVFESPYYYLQPNDVVYVEPNKKAKKESKETTTEVLRNSVTFLSLITSIFAVVSLIL
ncbi:MAG: polysaccharide biosynthesis/export family protein [Rikenellaceae bacterium]